MTEDKNVVKSNSGELKLKKFGRYTERMATGLEMISYKSLSYKEDLKRQKQRKNNTKNVTKSYKEKAGG